MNRSHFAALKGRKVVFKLVNSFPDLKVQFVESFPDFEVKVSDSRSFANEIIKIQVVTSFPDVKLKKVRSFGDFEAYFE